MSNPEIVQVNLTLPEVDVILRSMGQQPYDMVADLIANIRNQVVPQVAAARQPKPETVTENTGGTD